MRASRTVAACVVVAAILSGAARQAPAGFIVTFGVGGLSDSVSDFDGSTGDARDLNLLADFIDVTSIDVGDYTFALSASGTNAPGDPSLAFLITSVLVTRNTGTGTDPVFVRVTATDFAFPVAPPDIDVTSQALAQFLVPGADADISYAAWVNPGNTADGMETLVGNGMGTLQPQLPLLLSDVATLSSLSDPYSLTLELRADDGFGAGSSVQLGGQLFLTGATVTPIPEPSSLVLLSIGGIGIAARRRRCQARRKSV